MEELRNENYDVESSDEESYDYVTETDGKSSKKVIGLALALAGAVGGGLAYLHSKHKSKKQSNKDEKKSRKALRLVDLDEYGNIIVPCDAIEEDLFEEDLEPED